MSKNRILIVEDETAIARMIAMNLGVANYETQIYSDGIKAKEALVCDHEYDLALLDVMLPGIQILNMEINFEEHTVRQNGEEVQLKPMEFELLAALAKNKNIAISRENLLRMVWGTDYMGETRTVDVHIGQLRKKLGLSGHIKTVSKLGYRLEE